MLQIGARIRQARLAQGLSQGDLETRTGLLRCYLSRVENGHTEPSLQTLVRLAKALEMPLVEFFTEPMAASDAPLPPRLKQGEMVFLTQMSQFASALSDPDRQKILELARDMAAQEAAGSKQTVISNK